MLNLFRTNGFKTVFGGRRGGGKSVSPLPLAEIASVTVAHRSSRYWHRDGTIAAMIAAAESVQHLGVEAIIDAMEHEIKQREFICDFDDPCDAWAA